MNGQIVVMLKQTKTMSKTKTTKISILKLLKKMSTISTTMYDQPIMVINSSKQCLNCRKLCLNGRKRCQIYKNNV